MLATSTVILYSVCAWNHEYDTGSAWHFYVVLSVCFFFCFSFSVWPLFVLMSYFRNKTFSLTIVVSISLWRHCHNLVYDKHQTVHIKYISKNIFKYKIVYFSGANRQKSKWQVNKLCLNRQKRVSKSMK